MKKLRNLFVGGFMVFTTQVSAQEMPEYSLETIPQENLEIIVRNESLTIIAVKPQDEKVGNVNNIVVLCPMVPLTKVFSENGAVVYASLLTGKNLKDGFEQSAANADSGARERGIPFINVSYVDTNGNLKPAYTLNQIITFAEAMNQGKLSETGSPLKGNQTLIKNIAKHVDDFCFGAG